MSNDEVFPDFQKELDRAHAELQQLGEDIKHAQAVFNSALVSNKTGVVISSPDGEIVLRNPAAERIFGPDPHSDQADETVGYRAYRPDGTPIDNKYWVLEKAIDEQRAVSPYEMVIERDDGARHIVHCSASPLFDPEGNVTGALGLVTDVTDLKKVQQAERLARKTAEQAAERMSTLHQVTSALLDTLSPEGAVRVATEQAAELLDADRALGTLRIDQDTLRVVADETPGPESPPTMEDRKLDIDAAVPSSEAFRLATPIFVADTDELEKRFPSLATQPNGDVEASASVPFLVNGDRLGTLELRFAAPREFDEQERSLLKTLASQVAQAIRRGQLYRETNAARRESNRHADQQHAFAELARQALEVDSATLVDRSLDVLDELLDIDAATYVEYCDDSTLRVRAGTGAGSEWVGVRLDDLDQQTALGQALTTQEVVQVDDFSRSPFPPTRLARESGMASALFTRIPGKRRPHGVLGVLAGRPSELDNIDVEFVRGIANLLSDAIERERAHQRRQATYERLTEAIRDREDLLSVVAHDLRSPATTLKLNLGLIRDDLKRGEASPQSIERSLDAAEVSLERMVDLMTDLLDAARRRDEGQGLQLEPIDFVESLRRIAEGFNGQLTASGSTISVIGDREILGESDRLRFEQIAMNLLNNAVKYGDGKPIEATLAADDDQVYLTVEDHGIGIPLERQREIFRRFHRAETDEDRDSYGLGLWIVQENVEALGGTIDVESEPEHGSTFTVTVPRYLKPNRSPNRGANEPAARP